MSPELAVREDNTKDCIALPFSQSSPSATEPQGESTIPPSENLTSSPPSILSSLPPSPLLSESVYNEHDEQVERDEQDEMTSLSAYNTIAVQTSRRAVSRLAGIDVCADPGMVAALRVPDTDPNVPMIFSGFRRASTRIRMASASNSASPMGSSTISTTRTPKVSMGTRKHRNVKTRGRRFSKQVKEEILDNDKTGGGDLENPDAPPLKRQKIKLQPGPPGNEPSLGSGIGASLALSAPTTDSSSVPISKPPVKKAKLHKLRQTHEWVNIIDPNHVSPISKSPTGEPEVKHGESSARAIEPLGNLRRSLTQDLGPLNTLNSMRTVIYKSSMYDDTPTKTRLRPRKPPVVQQAKPSVQPAKPGDTKRKRSSSTSQSGDDESDVRSRRDSKRVVTGEPSSSSDSGNDSEDLESESAISKSYVEENGSTSSFPVTTPTGVGDELRSTPETSAGGGTPTSGLDVVQESLEGRNVSAEEKLDTKDKFVATAERQGGIVDVPDSRVHKDAFKVINGVLSIPHGCQRCIESRSFCNRDMPCGRCKREGKECIRKEGWVLAKPKAQRRPTKQDTTSNVPSHNAISLKPLAQAKPGPGRGRPKKIEIKNEVSTVATLPSSSTDFQEGKPPGIRRPEVWCESRQELCESLPYYRSYQSGCYGHDGLVHGYLLDGFASPRDYVGGKVIISHSGGKSAAGDDGQRRLLMDQTSEDKVIKYLLTNMKQKWPLVMIMGNQCANSPSRVPHRYCVMDWFKVTAGWAERDPRSKYARWKFRFEKLNTTTDGWWAATPSEEPEQPWEMVKACCVKCLRESPHVYEQGWACLNPDCPHFWVLDGVEMPDQLTYAEHFLQCRTQWDEDFLIPPNSLAPPLDTEVTAHVESGGVSRPFWKGMCCPHCGRLSCRELWAGWNCLSCGFNYDPPRTIFDERRLADPHRPIYTGPAIPNNICSDLITSKRSIRNGMTVIQYNLGDSGTVTHILANRESNSKPGDANWLLENYQHVDMPFKRFPMKNHHSQGRLLTQQFTFNCGAPYKFIVDVNSYSFQNSPRVVLRALEVIHDRVSLVHPEARFNEVLSVGYFEKQKMDYHDDGEEGLGETVASISLGGTARMKFRVKAKFRNDRHCWTTEPEPRYPAQALSNEIPNEDLPEEIGDEDEDETAVDAASGTQANLPSGRVQKNQKARAMLDLCLNHGDVMVMKGREIQKYWEHTVIPQGLFRIAATARYISSRHPGVIEQDGVKNPGEYRDEMAPPSGGYPSVGPENNNPSNSVNQVDAAPTPSSLPTVTEGSSLISNSPSLPFKFHETDLYGKPEAPPLSPPTTSPGTLQFPTPAASTAAPFPNPPASGAFPNGSQQSHPQEYPHYQGSPLPGAHQHGGSPIYQQNSQNTQLFPTGQNFFYHPGLSYPPGLIHQPGLLYQPRPSSQPGPSYQRGAPPQPGPSSSPEPSQRQYQQTMQTQQSPFGQPFLPNNFFASHTSNQRHPFPLGLYGNSQGLSSYQASPNRNNGEGSSSGSHAGGGKRST